MSLSLILSKFGQNLPIFNFVIASTALTFQMSVLYPWHLQLDHDFEKMKLENEAKLLEYQKESSQHQIRMETLLTDIRDKLGTKQ